MHASAASLTIRFDCHGMKHIIHMVHHIEHREYASCDKNKLLLYLFPDDSLLFNNGYDTVKTLNTALRKFCICFN